MTSAAPLSTTASAPEPTGPQHSSSRPDASTATTPGRVRSVVDVIRLFLGLGLVAAGVAAARVFDSTLLGLALDLTSALDGLPGWLPQVGGAAAASVLVGGSALLLAGSLITTRYRRVCLLAVGIATASALSIVTGRYLASIVEPSVRAGLDVEVPLFRLTGADGLLNPADPILAAASAVLTIAGAYLTRETVRRSAWLIGFYACVSAMTIGAPPIALLTDIGIGVAVGSALLWVFGRHDLALDVDDVRRALRSSGIDVGRLSVAPAEAGRGWLALRPDGRRLFIVAFDRDDRAADLLVRAGRWVRFGRTGDHRPFLTLQRAVEHEALVWQTAATRGVRAPQIEVVAPAGVEGMVLARDWIDGKAASEIAELSDDTLQELWSDVERLQHARIAHGSLHLGNVVVDDDGRPQLVRYDRAELAATDRRLGTDLAELLASTAAKIGTDRAVRLAVQSVGSGRLEQALPWLQPLALSRTTGAALVDGDGFEQLRHQLAAACGLPDEDPVPLQRIDAKTLFVLATLVLSAWFLLPQLADLDSIWSQARTASWPWALAAVAFSIGTYVAATGSLLGAIPIRLRFGPALLAQIASSFANRVTPVKVGGVATNIRYFQREGVPVAVSATAVGLNAITGVFVHLVLTIGFLLLASGDERAGDLHLPSTAAVVLTLTGVAVAAGVATFVPITRQLIADHVLPQLKSGWTALKEIFSEPTRLMLLVGCSSAITLCYLGAMIASLLAFGSDASLLIVALLFLTGSAVANAAPTPGGLGAAEAALVAAFSTVEAAAIVVPAVFLYRLVTFWLPILPGWLALTYLRSTDRL